MVDRVHAPFLGGPDDNGEAANDMAPSHDHPMLEKMREGMKNAWQNLSADQQAAIRSRMATIRQRWQAKHPGRTFPGKGVPFRG